MNINLENLLFCPLDIQPPKFYENRYLDSLSYSDMDYSSYLNCYIVPLYTKDQKWTYHSRMMPCLVNWLINNVFPWCLGRTNILCTPPHGKISPHIDCAKHEVYTPQHKFRYVLQGITSSMSFLTKNGSINVPNVSIPFIISGNWPHEMYNHTCERKYTLAIGAPWNPSLEDKDYYTMILKNVEQFKEFCLWHNGWHCLPNNFESLLKNDYK